MKLCSVCKERPVDSPRGKYCAECRATLRRGKTEPAVEKPVETAENQFNGCVGCVHWRDCGHGMKCCHLTADTGRLRLLPYTECYRHMGTDYEEGKDA